MSGDCVKTFKLEVEIQENGIIRDPFGWIIGRCDDDWLKLVTRHEMEPNGLTVSSDNELIKWRGENYIRQHEIPDDQTCDEPRQMEFCASCRYFVPDVVEWSDCGLCQRFPVTVTKNKGDYCGEYARRDDAE